MLTISQVAAYAGVTVRAIRHYHQCGLLPEPSRDQSGYRRYDSGAVITVTRIKALGQAGVPLSKIPSLLQAEPDELRNVIPELDAELTRRIDELEDTRLRLRTLGSGERVFLTDDIAAHLERLADLGLTREQMAVERDTWSLLLALYPRRVGEWLDHAARLLDDEDIARLYVDIHAVREIPPDDPRIAHVATRAAALARRAAGNYRAASDMSTDAKAFRLVNDHALTLSPAWTRLMELGRQELHAT